MSKHGCIFTENNCILSLESAVLGHVKFKGSLAHSGSSSVMCLL